MPPDDGLADRRSRVRVAVEQAGIAVGQELLALVDEEERRIAGDLGRAVRRVVDGNDEGVGASQSFVITCRTGPNAAAVTTTSADEIASLALACTPAPADARRRARRLGERLRSVR